MVTNITREQLYINRTISSGLDRFSGILLPNSGVLGYSAAVDGANVNGLGTTDGSLLEEEMLQYQHHEAGGSLNYVDYDDGLNISGDRWLNYSCRSLQVPTHFIKNILEPIICGCGIAGIALTMIVLSKKTMVTSTNCYLTALAVADLLFLSLLLTRIYVDKTLDCHFHLSSEAALFNLYSVIFMEVFQYLTVGITVMLAVERYIAICHPMKALAICTVRRARAVIVILTVISLILRAPKFFELDISYVTMDSGQRELVVTYVYLYDEAIYTYIVTGVILTLFPLVSLTVLNIRLIVEIRRSYRYLQYHLGTDWHIRSLVSREELKMTMMLVSVVVAFFLCHTPYMVYTFMLAVDKFDTLENKDLTNSNSWQHFRNVCNILLALKSSCNFILYCWFSEKFWITFKRIFCLQHCPPKQASIQPTGFPHSNHNNFHRPSCYITKETTC